MSDAAIQLAGLAACLTLKNLAWMSVSRRQKRQVGSIEKVVIYPVKSCCGILIDSAEIDTGGLRCGDVRDRSYTVVSGDDMRFVSLKTLVTLSRVQPQLQPNGGISLTAKGRRTLPVRHVGKVVNFRMRSEPLTGVDCGDEAAEWLSEVCEQPNLRLVYCPDTGRKVSGRLKKMDAKGGMYDTYAAAYEQPDGVLGLTDESPILMLSDKSLKTLNSRLDGEHPGVDWRNFRPNLLVSGVSEDQAEDTWGFVFVGTCVLTGLFPCERCMMVNIDLVSQSEGRMPAGMPVLKALSRYRTLPQFKNPLMGIECTVHVPGAVAVGDAVLVD